MTQICSLFIFFIYFFILIFYIHFFSTLPRYNCGGDDNLFIYYPPQQLALTDCPSFKWEVTVSIGVEEGEELYSSSVSSCELQFLNPPTGGECGVRSDGDTELGADCDVLAFGKANIVCRFVLGGGRVFFFFFFFLISLFFFFFFFLEI